MELSFLPLDRSFSPERSEAFKQTEERATLVHRVTSIGPLISVVTTMENMWVAIAQTVRSLDKTA